MKNRIFAIENWMNVREENIEKNILSKLSPNENDKILVYVDSANYKTQDDLDKKSKEISEKIGHPVTYIATDKSSVGKNRATFKNFVLKDIYQKYVTDEDHPWIYVIEDDIAILKDPSTFYNKIEELITFLDYGIWFNTIMDVCNYVYNKYDSRANIVIDDPECKKIFDNTILWCSHSNPSVLIANTEIVEKNEIIDGLFDESFYIPMFWILKYLATRRIKHPETYMMNFYPTIPEENKIYEKVSGLGEEQVSKELFKAEDVKFRSQNIDLTPMTDIEEALNLIYKKFKEKKPNGNK